MYKISTYNSHRYKKYKITFKKLTLTHCYTTIATARIYNQKISILLISRMITIFFFLLLYIYIYTQESQTFKGLARI